MTCIKYKNIENFNSAIIKIRNSEYCENPSKTLMVEAKKVCDCISVDTAERYSFTKYLIAAKMFSNENFSSYNIKIPMEEILVTTEGYPMIEKQKLLT